MFGVKVQTGQQLINKCVNATKALLQDSTYKGGAISQTKDELAGISRSAENFTKSTVNELRHLTNRADVNTDVKRFGKYSAYVGGIGMGIAGANYAFSND